MIHWLLSVLRSAWNQDPVSVFIVLCALEFVVVLAVLYLSYP